MQATMTVMNNSGSDSENIINSDSDGNSDSGNPHMFIIYINR